MDVCYFFAKFPQLIFRYKITLVKLDAVIKFDNSDILLVFLSKESKNYPCGKSFTCHFCHLERIQVLMFRYSNFLKLAMLMFRFSTLLIVSY